MTHNTSSLTSPTDLAAHFASLILDLDKMLANAQIALTDDHAELTQTNLARYISSDELESACSRIDSPYYTPSCESSFSDIMITDFLFAHLIMNRTNCTYRDICYYY
jgi:hypothetical protein